MLCSGDTLLEPLVACAGATLQAVAPPSTSPCGPGACALRETSTSRDARRGPRGAAACTRPVLRRALVTVTAASTGLSLARCSSSASSGRGRRRTSFGLVCGPFRARPKPHGALGRGGRGDCGDRGPQRRAATGGDARTSAGVAAASAAAVGASPTRSTSRPTTSWCARISTTTRPCASSNAGRDGKTSVSLSGSLAPWPRQERRAGAETR